ncbi:MAG: hypothetical protein NTZ98_20685, partial [Acidobacteria bacterium]|nr:hypothetical protein [Acidobacteriota bacterium]
MIAKQRRKRAVPYLAVGVAVLAACTSSLPAQTGCMPSWWESGLYLSNPCGQTGEVPCGNEIYKSLYYNVRFPDGYSNNPYLGARGRADSPYTCVAGVAVPQRATECWPRFLQPTSGPGWFTAAAW